MERGRKFGIPRNNTTVSHAYSAEYGQGKRMDTIGSQMRGIYSVLIVGLVLLAIVAIALGIDYALPGKRIFW